ncbi:MAG: hemoglobin [Methylophagaceae bacterium]|jgi:hemoglobin
MAKVTNYKRKQSLYDAVGGQDGITILVNVFYDFVESTPEGGPVVKLHLRGHGIGHARVELVNFLSGFLGGPNVFAEKWGHSNVRHIHDHVKINQQASDSWMACMEMAMAERDYDTELKQRLRENFQVITTLLINE